MKKTIRIGIMTLSTFAFLGLSTQAFAEGMTGEKIYKSKCKSCHAFEKKKFGPAFSKMNTDADFLKSAIENGKKKMPKFKTRLSSQEIDSMVKFIQSKQPEEECGCSVEK